MTTPVSHSPKINYKINVQQHINNIMHEKYKQSENLIFLKIFRTRHSIIPPQKNADMTHRLRLIKHK